MNQMAYLYAPKVYGNQPYWFWEGPPEIREWGCGPGKGIGDRIVPDHLLGLSIKIACSIHDHMYFWGVTKDDKEMADRVFLQNMNRLIKAKGGLLKPARYLLAITYYNAVSHFGTTSFWNKKHEEDLIGVYV